MPLPPTVRPAVEDDLRGIGADLAAAFDGDPLWRWVCPRPQTWEPRATRYFTGDARTRLRNGGTVLVPEGGGAAALWAPPDRWRTGPADIAHDLLPALGLFRHRTLRAMRVLTAIERHHPTAPHWHLAVLGTRPDRQGRGLGSALIAPITERCDEEGVGAYLESSKEANVPFYRHHGFEVVETMVVGNGPEMWLMWRDPQPVG